MSWGLVTHEWRFKLLAVGLAVLMLGAVAFSQNPLTHEALSVPLVYIKEPASIILINPPGNQTVNISGLADAISAASSRNVIATVDLSRAQAGPAVRMNISVSAPPGVSVQSLPPITLNIDTRQGKDVPVTVNARPAAGWTITRHDAICGAQSSSCTVHFDGPASWQTNLQAFVDFPGQVNVSSIDSSNWQVRLQNSNGPIDLSSCRTTPCAALDTTTVAVHITAVPGLTSTTVALVDAAPSHPPASGYRITNVTITPNTVIISGDPVALGKIRNIMLSALDLSGRTSDATFQVQITYPAGINSDTQVATIKYSISPNPAVSPGG